MNMENREALTAAEEFTRADAASPSLFSPVGVLRLVHGRGRLIAGVAGCAMIATILLLLQLTPRYTASALVLLDQRKNNVEDMGAVLSGLPTDPASIQNQVEILRSQSLAERVIKRLKLAEDPKWRESAKPGWFDALGRLLPFGSPMPLESDEARDARLLLAIEKNLKAGLSVEPVGLSTTIQINYQSIDPREAARICNAIAEAYVEDQLDAKFEATQKATHWLSDRIQELSHQVEGAERAVQQYKAEHNLTQTESGASLVDEQVSNLSAQLIAAKSALAQRHAIYNRVQQLQKTGDLSDLSQVVSSPLIGQLRQQETDLLRQQADMATRYGSEHPKMLELKSQVKNLQSKIDEEIKRIVQSIANDDAVAAAQVGSLEASMAQLAHESQSQKEDEVQLKSLQAAAASSRAMYEAFLSRLKEAQGQEGIQAPDARVITPANVPQAPSFPRKTLILGGMIPGSLILGLLAALLIEKLDFGFRTTAQVEEILGLPVLATVPEVTQAGEGAATARRVIDKPLSSYAEAIRGLRFGLSLSNVDKPPRVVLVTSAVSGEGKSTIALSIARSAARTGLKVLVIDGDLRRPSIADMAGVALSHPGLVEVLSRSVALDKAIARDNASPAAVLPAQRAENASPPDLLGSRTMQQLITALRQVYDLVVIDSAPALPVNDTKLLTGLADAILFVARWDKTPRDAAATAVRGLTDVGARISGVVLSRADTTRFRYYNYGYQNYKNDNKYYSD